MHYTEMSKSHLTLDYKILFEIGEFQKKDVLISCLKTSVIMFLLYIYQLNINFP